MNADTTTHPVPSWQILGKLDLLVSTNMEDTLYAWLTEILHSLCLQTDLLNKIILSAQEAAVRTIHSERKIKFEHLHFTVFIPSEQGPKEQAWGFFCLEKLESARENYKDGNHAVEFYLYGEGE